jgi:hypothetical protein
LLARGVPHRIAVLIPEHAPESFWELAGEGGTFAQGVENYLLNVAGVDQKDIDDFRSLMLE